MIDTIILKSLYIDEDTARKIENNSDNRYSTRKIDGMETIIYHFTQSALQGSWDSSIRIRVKRTDYFKSPITNSIELRDCFPYLEIECSLHKIILGHNIFGGSDDLKPQVRFLVKLINEAFNINLDENYNFLLKKLDVTYTFDMGNENEVMNFLHNSANVAYPRRNISKYCSAVGSTGLYVAGDTTTIKFYHKGSEFRVHDRKKLKALLPTYQIDDLQFVADKLLRIEVSIKKKKLQYDFNKNSDEQKELLDNLFDFDNYYDIINTVNLVTIKDITPDYIMQVWANDIQKLLKEGAITMNSKIVRTSEAVQERINSLKDDKNQTFLHAVYGFWSCISLHGDVFVKTKYKKSVYYKYRKFLIDNSIAWSNTDITLFDNPVINFTPSLELAFSSGLNAPCPEFLEILKKRLAS